MKEQIVNPGGLQALSEQIGTLNSKITIPVNVFRTDAQFVTMITNNTMFACVLFDTSKTMKLLSALNATYCWLIIGDCNATWASHPEFIAFTESKLAVGQLNVSNGDYTVMAIHPATLN